MLQAEVGNVLGNASDGQTTDTGQFCWHLIKLRFRISFSLTYLDTQNSDGKKSSPLLSLPFILKNRSAQRLVSFNNLFKKGRIKGNAFYHLPSSISYFFQKKKNSYQQHRHENYFNGLMWTDFEQMVNSLTIG